MVKWRTRLYGYTTYRRSEIEWENTFILQFSRYLSSNIFIFALMTQDYAIINLAIGK